MAITTLTTAQEAYNKYSASTEGRIDKDIASLKELILNKIGSAITAQANYSNTYADIDFNLFGTKKTTILEWINFSTNEEDYRNNTEDNFLEHRKYGLTDADNKWYCHIAKTLSGDPAASNENERGYGYNWIFLYYRDQIQPYGIRVSWKMTDDATEEFYAPNEDPNLIEAWNQHGFELLPNNVYVLPKAEEVPQASSVTTQEYNRNLLKHIFDAIGTKVVGAAQENYQHVIIPWTTFNDPVQAQRAFVQLKNGVSAPTNNMSSLAVHSAFNYPSVTIEEAGYGFYNTNNIAFTAFTDTDFNPYDMGFFEDSSLNEYELWPEGDEGMPFTLHYLLTNKNVLGYRMFFYCRLDIDNNYAPYCAGIALDWSGKTDVDTLPVLEELKTLYRYDINLQNQETAPNYFWDTIPEYEHYLTATRSINANRLKKFVDLTASKMEDAFVRGQRSISILWSEIDAEHPDQVRDRWTTSCIFSGTFKVDYIHHTDGEDPSFSGDSAENMSMSAAYNSLMKASKYNPDWDQLASGSIGDYHFIWDDIKYKGETATCGIAVVLTNPGEHLTNASKDTYSKVKGYLTSIQRTFADTENPKKKK